LPTDYLICRKGESVPLIWQNDSSLLCTSKPLPFYCTFWLK
jgi:hypothetical protein